VITTFGACKSPEVRKPVQNNSGTYILKSAKRNKAIFEKEEKQIIQLLDSKPEQEYFSSEEGFWYFYNKKDTTATLKPVFGDHILFSYNVKKLNGTVIFSEKEIGLQDYIVDKTNQKLINGIRDGVKLMKEGEVITFLIPSFNAYSYYGIENKLGTNVPIMSTVTLIKINKNN
jgi:gliding motility-associated peptidyl-prolyl isomerase